MTLAGLVSRFIGFFYRIFLSHTIGAEGMGIYQLVFPVYAMVFSLTSAGIQTAISRNVSGRLAVGDKKGARDTFFSGLVLAFGSTLLVSFFIYQQAGWIAASILHEARCEPLLRLLAYALPFGSLHSSISGYYYAIKKTHVPAISQLIEQVARVSASYLAYVIMLEKGLPVTPLLAMIGMLCEEVLSALYCITMTFFHFRKIRFPRSIFEFGRPAKQLLTLSLPLTANKVLLNLLQSIEAICIPLKLQLAGLTNSAALSVYGVLTGMSMPMVLFPSAITSAISVMLLPTVAESQASGNHGRIARTIESTVQYSLILGILCTGVFLCFGEDLGTLVFKDPSAGQFITILAWICPFLYLGTTLTSILNGLGKTLASFIQNACSLAVRIGFVWFAIPVFGITGYLWGILISQLAIAATSLLLLYRYTPFRFDSLGWILKPCLTMVISIGCMYFFRYAIILLNFSLNPLIEMFLAGAVLCAVYIGIMFCSDITYFLRKKR